MLLTIFLALVVVLLLCADPAKLVHLAVAQPPVDILAGEIGRSWTSSMSRVYQYSGRLFIIMEGLHVVEYTTIRPVD